MHEKVIRVGTVVDIESITSKDDAFANRIRVQLENDIIKTGKPSDYPWCFPLLPKTFQATPKVGEAVIIITATLGDTKSQRYYIGPIISQPQYNTKTPADVARTFIGENAYKPDQSIRLNANTNGSFPDGNDVAVIGRGQEDITLKYDDIKKSSEVDIRAGIRGGYQNVDFNKTDPAYVQVKKKPGMSASGNSAVNIVADNVNIISNKDSNVIDKIHDPDTLVDDKKFDEVMSSLHVLPYGDKLVEVLELMRGAILNHVHPWPGLPQCGDDGGYVKSLVSYPLSSIVSKNVRIS